MHPRLLVRAMFGLALCSSAAWAGAPEPAKWGGDGATVTARLSVAEAIQVGGVTVFPVVDRSGAKEDDSASYLTLADALRAGSIRVSEETDGGTVARLRVHNTGKLPVLVMAGEVVTGGRQDRVITRDVVIEPTDRPISVDVNCVEKGRWATASLGESFGYGGRAEPGLRRVVQIERSQDATWHAVARINAGSGVDPSTGTYMASIRGGAGDGRADKLGDEVLERLDKVHGVVGMVVAFDGRVVASEVYAHPELFDRVAAASLDAVAREAVSRGVIDREPGRPSSVLAARFLADAVGSPGITPTAAPVEGRASVSYVLHDDAGRLVHLASYAR